MNLNNEIENRDLPVVEAAGEQWYADAYRDLLINVREPSIRLHSYEMLRFEDCFQFEFDTVNKRIVGYPEERPDHLTMNYEYVSIRPIRTLDPEGADLLAKKHEWIFPELYQTPLPVVRIAGTEFYVDEIRKGFREVNNRWNILKYSEISKTNEVYFDKKANNAAYSWEIAQYSSKGKFPDHIILTTVPSREERKELLKGVIAANGKPVLDMKEKVSERNRIKRKQKL